MNTKYFSLKSFALFASLAVIFLSGANISAQTKSAEKPTTKTDLPKITQVDEITVKELFAVPQENAKPLLVNFWATWCVPCREEFPDLVKIDEEYRGKIDFITITLDDPAEITRDVPEFLTEMKAKMPTYLLYTSKESEVIGAISKNWNGGLPFTVLYNEKREIVFSEQGIIKPPVLKAKIDNILAIKTSQISISELPKPKIRSVEEGKEDAKNDIDKGILKIKRYGLTMAIPENSIDELKEKYGIEISESGCVLINTTAEYFIAYNEVMKTEISRRFGIKFLEKLPL